MGPITLRWYGLMYVLGFLVGRVILRSRSRRGLLPLNGDGVDDYLIALFVGMLLGARLFYMMVYYVPPEGQSLHTRDFFAVWEGGLSFHGALLGMMGAILLFSHWKKVPTSALLDGLVAAAPPGLFLGRMGNFINAELYGRVTDGPLGMRFPIRDGSGAVVDWTEPRHPSQLYQGITEGLLAWLLVWFLATRIKRGGVLFACGIAWYAVARFFVEFFREKDAQLAYLFGWMTMGQALCLGMLILAAGVGAWFYRHGPILEEKSDDQAGGDSGATPDPSPGAAISK